MNPANWVRCIPPAPAEVPMGVIGNVEATTYTDPPFLESRSPIFSDSNFLRNLRQGLSRILHIIHKTILPYAI